MTINIQIVQTVLAVILTPSLFSMVGDLVASVLAQDGFPQIANDAIAWLVLLLAAAGSVLAANQFTSSLPGVAYALVIAVFLLVNGSMGKLRPWLVGLDWIQSNVFDVAWGKGGQPTVQGLAHVNVEGLAINAVQSLLPEIERLFQQYNKPVPPARVQGPAPIIIPQRPLPPPQADNTLLQASNPQAVPAVDVASLSTRNIPVTTNAATPDPAPLARNWNDSGLIPSVGQPGQ